MVCKCRIFSLGSAAAAQVVAFAVMEGRERPAVSVCVCVTHTHVEPAHSYTVYRRASPRFGVISVSCTDFVDEFVADSESGPEYLRLLSQGRPPCGVHLCVGVWRFILLPVGGSGTTVRPWENPVLPVSPLVVWSRMEGNALADCSLPGRPASARVSSLDSCR